MQAKVPCATSEKKREKKYGEKEYASFSFPDS